MKKRWIIGSVLVLGIGGLAAAGGGASGGAGTSPSGGTQASASGWSVHVAGARGLRADCTWEVMQGGSSHSGSRTVVVPATIKLGDADIVSANCQKQEDGARVLSVRLVKDGDAKQSSDASNAYGVASVSGS